MLVAWRRLVDEFVDTGLPVVVLLCAFGVLRVTMIRSNLGDIFAVRLRMLDQLVVIPTVGATLGVLLVATAVHQDHTTFTICELAPAPLRRQQPAPLKLTEPLVTHLCQKTIRHAHN